MHRQPQDTLRVPTRLAIVYREFERKAQFCADVLDEAHRLWLLDKDGSPLNQVIARAGELLDDIDEILVVLGCAAHGRAFATASTLRRDLEQLQTAITAQRLARAAKLRALDSQ
jgi:hypothetical protein